MKKICRKITLPTLLSPKLITYNIHPFRQIKEELGKSLSQPHDTDVTDLLWLSLKAKPFVTLHCKRVLLLNSPGFFERSQNPGTDKIKSYSGKKEDHVTALEA